MPEVPPLPSVSSSSSGRYGRPILQQLRSQPMNLGNGLVPCKNTNFSGVLYPNLAQNRVVNLDAEPETEKKMLNRLQELEKQLLDDNEDEQGDDVSVITGSEWSDTIQNLISPSQKPISPSPTSSSPSSSSSSSSSVASPAPTCHKQSLMEAASAISEGKTEAAAEIINRLTQALNPKGNSEQRLIAYMTTALKSRLCPSGNPPPVAELYWKEHMSSMQMLYDHSVCFKLGFMAANIAIAEATSNANAGATLHVIDFNVGQGGQYHNLVQYLSMKPSKPAIVKITAVEDLGNGGEERLMLVKEKLSQLGDRVGISVRFNVVSQLKICDLTRESLGCDSDEVLAVNLAFNLHRMPDESVSTENPRDELLRRVKGLGPRVVTVVEQEMNCNTAPFVARVGECCAYYGALFDSLDSSLVKDNYSDRVKIEEGLSRKLANSVACEGRDRVERCEVFGKWRARMGMAGFALEPLSQNVTESLRAKLNSGTRVNPGFMVKEENGGACFGWMGRTLTVASAWR
ncbi:hypothetical protein L1049_020966 [Liquidambar formosana]|uniref:Scarecrow-like protein 8 n=1 Tax=Liquidambar formosana TaxID=63359 RepID=A0AAP0SEP0_LIQFO